MYYETLLSDGWVAGVWRYILQGTSESSGEISSSRKQAWEERVRNWEWRGALKMGTTVQKEDRLPQVQVRLSVIQPKSLINLSSITFSIYLPWFSIANPALLELFIHSALLQERSPSVSFLQRRCMFAGRLYAIYTLQVCKSVHHHTLNRINQPDAANSQVYYLSFK